MNEALLSPLDWSIIIGYLVIVVGIGFVFAKKAQQSKEQFFLSGRSMPWWLLGTSMAATHLSADAPLAITGLIAKEGIAGVWFKWCYLIMWSLGIFFFARLWRRATVITDAELVELRYSGRPARALRLLKGFYFGVLMNCFVMAWCMVAMAKIVAQSVGWNRLVTMSVFSFLALVYTVAGGYWGIVVADFFRFFLALAASLMLAVFAVQHVGGLAALKEKAEALYGPEIFNFLPEFGAATTTSDDVLSLSGTTFFVYIFLQWWSQKYSDGGGKQIQRMSSAKNERHAMLGTLWFAIATYAVQIWPWIVTGVVSLVMFPHLADAEAGYPMVMMAVLPHGLIGLMLCSLIAAFMAILDTHLNLGASYVVNDIYERFLHPNAPPKHYVRASQLTTVLLLVVSSLIAWQIDSVAGMWKFVITFAAGAGPTFIIRWFWWRANAWTEISGMIASGVIASYLRIMHPELEHATTMMLTASLSAVCWLSTTYLTAPVDEKVLVQFYERVVPATPWWAHIAKKARPTHAPLDFSGVMWRFATSIVGLYLVCFGLGFCIFRDLFLGIGMLVAGAIILTILVRSIENPLHTPQEPSLTDPAPESESGV
jgi:SSS family solute:Na+ symporter